MHFSFVPVIVGKNGKEKVSAKELLNKLELQRFHPALQTALKNVLGQEVPILNGATVGGNRTVTEMKAEQEIAIAQEKAEEASKMAEKIVGEVEALQGQKSALQNDLEGLQAKIMTEQEVQALKGKKTITGGLKGVSYTEYESLKKTARHVRRVEAERDKAIARAESAEQRVKAAEEKAEQAQKEKPSLKLQMENVQLKGRLGRMENWLTRLLNFIPEQLRAIIQNILQDRDPFKQEQQRSKKQNMEL